MKIVLGLFLLLLTGCQALPQLIISGAGAYKAWTVEDRLDELESRLKAVEQGLGENHLPDVGKKVEK